MKKLFVILFSVFFCMGAAHAEWGIIDALNIAPFVPLVLDALMSVATATYDFFVGKGDGIIYLICWSWLGISMGLYLVKMYLPKTWLELFGFKGGGEMYDGKLTGMQIGENLLKPAIRAMLAAIVFLQVKPVFITDYVVDPFLQFGGYYTESITDTINHGSRFGVAKELDCPASVIEKGWISESSCKFLIQPVSDITHANNQIIKRGFQFLDKGLRSLMTLIPHGGNAFLNIITGLLLITTFVTSNFFMALLIINGIFELGISLILFPFKVLTFVIKQSDKWIDPWPPFMGIVKALQRLVITLIACAFILAVNLSVIKALMSWNNSVFVGAVGGSAYSNIPMAGGAAAGFGQHSVVWLTALLTFFIMWKIFDMTKKKLTEYVGEGMDATYKKVSGDAKKSWEKAKKSREWFMKAFNKSARKKLDK